LTSIADGNIPVAHTKVDKKKQEQALKLIHKTMGMNTRVIQNVRDIETTREVYPRETIVFQNCRDCKYTVSGQCAIIMITDCENFKLILNANVRTHVMELWRCNNISLKLNTNIQTLQIDLSNNVDVHYKTVNAFRDVVWSASEDVEVTFGDSADRVHTGYTLAIPHYPDDDLKFDKTQFFIRYIDGMLRVEKVLRLSNGFATTKRQHAKWKARQDQRAFDLAKKWGIKIGPKKPGMKIENSPAAVPSSSSALSPAADPLATLMGPQSSDPLASATMTNEPNASDVMRLFNSIV
jgi:hypothetical protein